MKVIKLFFLIALIYVDIAAFSQDSTYVLTLAQAREYALQHNRTLLNARDQVSSSKEKLKETIANGLPQISGSLDYMTYFGYEAEFDFFSSSTWEPTEVQRDQAWLSTTAEYSGFTVADLNNYNAGTMYNGILQSMAPPTVIEMTDAANAKVQLGQLIFSGQYFEGIKIAKIALKLADQSLISNELDIKENISNTYYLILTNEQTLGIISENLKNLEDILLHTSNMYKAGLMEETDVDQLKITVSQLKNTQKSLERMVKLSYNMLKFQLGVAPETNISLADSLDQIITFVEPQSVVLPNFDISSNVNYQLMESQVLLSKKQVNLQNWSYAPTITGFYSYTEKLKTTGFDMNPNHVAGVTVSVPIFSSGMRNAQVSQAKIGLDIAQRNQEMVKDQLTMQEQQLVFNYQSAIENYSTQKENVETAGRVYKSFQNKYKQGVASSLDLTQASSNYLTAESNYLSAVLTLLQAETSLKKLYNTL